MSMPGHGTFQHATYTWAALQSKDEAGGTGNVDLKSAAQGLRLPSPGVSLPGPSVGFQAPRNEDWRSKFRSSDSFTSDRGTPVLPPMPCESNMMSPGACFAAEMHVLQLSSSSSLDASCCHQVSARYVQAQQAVSRQSYQNLFCTMSMLPPA